MQRAHNVAAWPPRRRRLCGTGLETRSPQDRRCCKALPLAARRSGAPYVRKLLLKPCSSGATV